MESHPIFIDLEASHIFSRNIRTLYRAGSLITVSREILKYRLDLVGVQEVRWDGLIFCIRHTLETQWEYNETIYQLTTDFKKAYDSVRREVLYNILVECGVSMKLVRPIKCV
jgi:hypothetical protein